MSFKSFMNTHVAPTVLLGLSAMGFAGSAEAKNGKYQPLSDNNGRITGKAIAGCENSYRIHTQIQEKKVTVDQSTATRIAENVSACKEEGMDAAYITQHNLEKPFAPRSTVKAGEQALEARCSVIQRDQSQKNIFQKARDLLNGNKLIEVCDGNGKTQGFYLQMSAKAAAEQKKAGVNAAKERLGFGK